MLTEKQKKIARFGIGIRYFPAIFAALLFAFMVIWFYSISSTRNPAYSLRSPFTSPYFILLFIDAVLFIVSLSFATGNSNINNLPEVVIPQAEKMTKDKLDYSFLLSTAISRAKEMDDGSDLKELIDKVKTFRFLKAKHEQLEKELSEIRKAIENK